ncbi:MAG: DEAD/DEAH box helicase family protein [bacterium]|nr:DEAD/DEAH box helicase family protein [bacterium]
MPDWVGPDGSLGRFIRQESINTLKAYEDQPNLVTEHANTEDALARGGYADRQLLELIQNSTDALAGTGGGRIRVKLTRSYLYCADDGLPIDESGVRALMFSRMSTKRGTSQIGRYGLGFKSVLNVTDKPEFFSRNGSFRFDKAYAQEEIRRRVPGARRTPTLRLPYPIDPLFAFRNDRTLRLLALRFANIVRLPLRRGTYERLAVQASLFPPEFLLFVEHIRALVLDVADWEVGRTFQCRKEGDQCELIRNDQASTWRVFRQVHNLSDAARADRRTSDDEKYVEITWAVPLKRLAEPGYFWKFFPTMTPSLIAGILNTQWKTNEDRQNLLPGTLNEELIRAASKLIVASLPKLATDSDPARHLDALPRRREAGDNALTDMLRTQLLQRLADRSVVPDQLGILRRITDVRYAPRHIPRSVLQRWASHSGRPRDWAHHRALTRDRLSMTSRILQQRSESRFVQVRLSTIAEWLEALVDSATDDESRIRASMVAIQIAASLPPDIRDGQPLGQVVWSASGRWSPLDAERIYLSGTDSATGDLFVHPRIEADRPTLNALLRLGIECPTPENRFRQIVDEVFTHLDAPLDSYWHDLWSKARLLDPGVSQRHIQSYGGWQSLLRLRTVEGHWNLISKCLLPGPIVPGDGSRDSHVAIDMSYHQPDLELIRRLGGTDTPISDYDFQSHESRAYNRYRLKCVNIYKAHLVANPLEKLLTFEKDTAKMSGPLGLLEALSEEGRVLYTDLLLQLPHTYSQWRLFHRTQAKYPPDDFWSPAVDYLKREGRIRVQFGVARLSDGLGTDPKIPEVRRWLLAHRNSALIRQAFDIRIGNIVRPDGASTSIPLIDEWPGLREHLPADQLILDLIRCDRLVSDDGDVGLKCFRRANSVYLVRGNDEDTELRAVLGELNVHLREKDIRRVILRQTRSDIAAARTNVRRMGSEAARLLTAVGYTNLRHGLPSGLRAMLNLGPNSTEQLRAAEAAIATYDVAALQKYRHYLTHLDPPRQWAGSYTTVEFVRSLGFGPEWAGQRKIPREPFVDVDGPYSLPPLHPYQAKIARNLIAMLGSGPTAVKRGLISLPTGSGKTRVAVQGIVDAIRQKYYVGGVLWIADRNELCEQAVESWRQVWSNRGVRAAPLRISRLWKGQKNPTAVPGQHVIVASIQTLYRRMPYLNYQDELLADFRLVVFDEAHRSIAPTFTRTMRQLGLTYRRRTDEPFLLGLTATPYRGHNAAETERLVRRYSQNRLDSGVFRSDNAEYVTRELQAMRVLAQADHMIIEGGQFSLRNDELSKMKDERLPWLPRRVEDEIAFDRERTKRLIAAYKTHIRGRNWPTLIFATSVDHAKTLAALLDMAGVKARSVDAGTDSSIRRKVVEDFREQRIDVLVNYGVFREGFDAPKTRAIMVARPVYSPNLYFQMIGRGLRGPLNGGNERCLILNVRDNIVNYEERLAFTELDWLWATGGR